MTIKSETHHLDTADERRRELRAAVGEGSVDIDGVLCSLENWSSSGFLARGYRGKDLALGDRVTVRVSVVIDDAENYFNCKALIVRTGPNQGRVAGAFVEMDPEDRLAINQLFD